MKIATSTILFGVVNAHYAIKELTIDGNKYLARDARLDDWVGAKRIEWGYKDNDNFTWMAHTDTSLPAFACGKDAVPPPLKAYARAGSEITVQWTKVPKHHLGPEMTYLGSWTPGQAPQEVQFFKIKGEGYDASKKLWANEKIIQNNNQDGPITIPSDIQPGLYILRTELLSLHGNGQKNNPGLKGLPQFYTHCYNIQITGEGTAKPEGVKFPGGYPKSDAGVGFILAGNKDRYASYPIPGPPIYKGQYNPPLGPPPVLTPSQTFSFPPDFEVKYKSLLAKMNVWSDKAVDFFDDGKNAFSFFRAHQQEADGLIKERALLRQEAVKLGLADPKMVMQESKIF